MPTAVKAEKVEELKGLIEGSAALLLTEHRGLSVSELAGLRRSLADVETTLAVVKNTLMRLAAVQAGVEELTQLLSGPSAVAFVGGDPVAAAKRISATAKQVPALVVKGGWMDGRLLSADEARSLAELESREAMLSKIAGLLAADVGRAASVLQALQARFLGVLEAYRGKLPTADDPVAPGAPEADEPPTPPDESPTPRDEGEAPDEVDIDEADAPAPAEARGEE